MERDVIPAKAGAFRYPVCFSSDELGSQACQIILHKELSR
jgi:hypothetical protein